MKRIWSTILATTMLLSLGACSSEPANTTAPSATPESSTDAPAPESSGEVITASLSCTVGQTSNIGIETEKFAADVAEKTNGQLIINTFYDGVLGAEQDVVQMVANDELEMTISGHVSVSMYAPEYGFIVAPFLIRSEEHVRNIFASDIYGEFQNKLLTENSLNLVFPYVRPARNLFTNEVIESADDLKGMTVRVPDDRLYFLAWSSVGANAQSLGVTEVYTAVETGVIDAYEGGNELVPLINGHEVTDYVYLTEHNIETGAFYASEAWLATLPDDLKEIFFACCEDYQVGLETISRDAADQVLQDMLDNGMELRSFDTTPMFDAANATWTEMFDTEWAYSFEEIMDLA